MRAEQGLNLNTLTYKEKKGVSKFIIFSDIDFSNISHFFCIHLGLNVFLFLFFYICLFVLPISVSALAEIDPVYI